MDIDDQLRRAGERWRSRQEAPPALPNFEEADMPAPAARHRTPLRLLIPVAAAAAVVALIFAILALTGVRRTSEPTGAASPAPRPATSTPAPGGSAAPSSRPPDCTAAQLAASIDTARTGVVHGKENVIILLRDTGERACWLGGIPRLSGVTSGGTAVPLPFTGSSDPAYADPGPANGPGPIAPGGFGALHLTMQVDSCGRPAVRYDRLRIELRQGQVVDMPYPGELAISGCFGDEAQAGPVVE